MSFLYRHGDRPVDGYTVLRGVGRGGFGEVYYAVSDGGREVALKVILQNAEIELRGVRHCINLKSPNLVSVFDVRHSEPGAGGAPARPFVVMEYVTGPSLRDILDERPEGLGAHEVGYLLRELGRGLDYLHARGIVHRDMKPENVFFEEGFVKIGDYGLSKFINGSHRSGQTISVGTVAYMAPEIGSGSYHKSIDVYALGIIAYELLTGELPFTGDSFGEILMKHLTAEPDLSRVPEAFRPVIAGALAKRPEDRFASAEDMMRGLFANRDFELGVAKFDPLSFSRVASRAQAAGQDAAPQLLPDRETVPAGPPPAAPAPKPSTDWVGKYSRAPDGRSEPSQARPRPFDSRRAGEEAVRGIGVAFGVVWYVAATLVRSISRGIASLFRVVREKAAFVIHKIFAERAQTRNDGGLPEPAVFSTGLPVPDVDPRPGAFARFFWVFVGSGLLAASASCFGALAFVVGHFYDFVVCLAVAVALPPLSIFCFYRGLMARKMSFWGRSLRPFLLAVFAAVVLFAGTFFVQLISLDAGFAEDEAIVALAFAASAAFCFAVVLKFGRVKIDSPGDDPSLPRAERPVSIVSRVASVGVACGLVIAALVSSIIGLLSPWAGPYDAFACTSMAVAFFALALYLFRLGARRRRGTIWRGVVRPFVLTVITATFAICGLPFFFDVNLRGEEFMVMVVAGSIALALGVAIVSLDFSRRPAPAAASDGVRRAA